MGCPGEQHVVGGLAPLALWLETKLDLSTQLSDLKISRSQGAPMLLEWKGILVYELKSVDSPRGTQSLSMTSTRLRQLKKLLSISIL